MWISDHYGRLINTDNVIYFDYTNKNEKKKTDTVLWTIQAQIRKRDWNSEGGQILWLTEGFSDKEEVHLRMKQIAEGIANGSDLLVLD